MEKNNCYGNIAAKAAVTATMASLLISNQGYAQTTETPVSSPNPEPGPTAQNGPLAGFFGEVAVSLNTASGIEISAEELSDTLTGNYEEIAPYLDKESTEYAGGRLFANVHTALNIRSLPSVSGERLGQLRPTDEATILSYADGWYEIMSGDVRGFVSEKYSIVGEEAESLHETLSVPTVTCMANKLNIRDEASTEGEILNSLERNERVMIDTEAEPIEGWVGIVAGGERGYVSTDYVDVDAGEIGTAIPAEQIDNEAKARAHASTVYNPGVFASADEETLLAALLICEAGSTYEGMLAVGGVVMNRLHAGYAGDIRGVIYQQGQFTPAGSGKVDAVIAGGVSESARAAAREALSGVDITGGCLNFRAAFTGHPGTNIGGNVFF